MINNSNNSIRDLEAQLEVERINNESYVEDITNLILEKFRAEDDENEMGDFVFEAVKDKIKNLSL